MQFLIVTGAVLILVGVFGIGWLVSHFVFGPTPTETTQKEVPGTFRPTKEQWASLKVAPVQAMTFRTGEVTDGYIAYNDDTTTPVFSPYSGRVTKLIAKPGDVVKKGAPLMAVEASEFVQGQSDLRTARAQLTLTEANEKRQHALYLAKAGALKDWLQAQADLTIAQNNLRAVRNRLRIFGISDQEIDAIEHGAGAQPINPKAYVLAPISGTVIQRQVSLGQYINSAATGASNPVYTIGNLSTVWLIANVREADAPRIRVGQPVEAHVLAYPGQVFKAKITWVAPAVDPNSRRVPVRAEVVNPDGALKPMMFASFRISTGEQAVAPAVPQSAIVYEGDEAHVFVVRDDGTVTARSIRVGRISGAMVEVSAGLAVGEKIVTGGTLFIDRTVEANNP
jgi:cobalt-zinc-cadmium efflux system membrane fusion protein